MLQKLLLLHAYCPRLWIQLGEILIAGKDVVCQRFGYQSPDSPVDISTMLDDTRLVNDSISLNSFTKGCDILRNGPSAATSANSEEPVTDLDSIDCKTSSVGDAQEMEANISARTLQALTCFAAAV